MTQVQPHSSQDIALAQVAEAAFDQAPDAMVLVDAAGRVALVNRQAEALFGYGREEIVGQAVEMLVPESPREAHVALRQRYQENPVAHAMGSGRKLVGITRDGREVDVDVKLGPVHTPDGF